MDLFDLEAIVFTNIQYRFSSSILKDYPSLTFTTEEQSETDVQFPNVYLTMTRAIEEGMTLEGNTLAANSVSFEIMVTDNQNQARVKEIMLEICRIMKSMLFEISGMPTYKNTKDKYYSIAYFTRVIGDGDLL